MVYITIKIKSKWNAGKVEIIWGIISQILDLAVVEERSMEWDNGFDCPNCQTFLVAYPNTKVKYCGYCGHEFEKKKG